MADAHSSRNKRKRKEAEQTLKELLYKNFAVRRNDGETILEKLQFEESGGYTLAAQLLRDDSFEERTKCETTELQTKKIPQDTSTQLQKELFGLLKAVRGTPLLSTLVPSLDDMLER